MGTLPSYTPRLDAAGYTLRNNSSSTYSVQGGHQERGASRTINQGAIVYHCDSNRISLFNLGKGCDSWTSVCTAPEPGIFPYGGFFIHQLLHENRGSRGDWQFFVTEDYELNHNEWKKTLPTIQLIMDVQKIYLNYVYTNYKLIRS